MLNGSSFSDVRERSRTTRTLADPDTFFTSDLGDMASAASPLVMVIDDSMCVRKVVELSLTNAGISTIAFPDGPTALEAFSSGRIAPPRVLLLDIGLPRMSGYDVAKLIHSRSDFDDTSIIMISSHDGVIDRARSLLIGRVDFIAKPFKRDELVRRVRRALGILDAKLGPSVDCPE
jgi:twitching motility two-component system response regulator PilG